MNLKKIISSVLVITLLGMVGQDFVAFAQSSDLGSDYKWFKLKKEAEQLTDAQKSRIKEKLQKARDKEKSLETMSFIEKHKKQRKWLKNQFRQKNLTQKQKEEIGEVLKSQRASLEDINGQLILDLKKAIRAELTNPEQELVERADPNVLLELQEIFAPNDPQYPSQWGAQSIAIEGLFEGNTFATSGTTVVAVIDAGVDFSHEDLSGKEWESASCVDENNQSISGGCLNGGYDFVDNDDDPYPTDNQTHGTSVSSLVGAKTNNSLGMASVSAYPLSEPNKEIEIMALRACCTVDGFMLSSDIEDAIRFAVNNGADVINASFGGPTYSQGIKDAIQYARDNNVLFITAAGNYASDNDTTPFYPANYDLENIISVA
ncbi:MAG: S8 family serine peptidase, partial [Candidatus Peregrinibacteria bacterium]|nr:S8 family serine peptidase [Candidatus Peregrinibacteria bacterium]